MTSQPQETMLLFKCPACVSGLICGGVAPASVSHIKRLGISFEKCNHSNKNYSKNCVYRHIYAH